MQIYALIGDLRADNPGKPTALFKTITHLVMDDYSFKF